MDVNLLYLGMSHGDMDIVYVLVMFGSELVVRFSKILTIASVSRWQYSNSACLVLSLTGPGVAGEISFPKSIAAINPCCMARSLYPILGTMAGRTDLIEKLP